MPTNLRAQHPVNFFAALLICVLASCVLVTATLASAAEIKPLITLVPEKIPCAVADKQESQVADRVHLSGWIGTRMDANEGNRLAKLDTDRLLEGYRHRPGRQTWDGEHVGKWLHAATLAWANSGNPALRTKLDTVVVELGRCQLPDGYLGTYAASNRWTEWDVWAHKYNLIGLITYMRYTGNMQPLPVCERMADLLCRTFGDQPGQRDIIEAGFHKGMAPTSVLEPMIWLYRLTGEKRYLDFCQYILRAWEQPNGPKIISTLLASKRVAEVGDAKAYEMLSCLNGALEYYRTVEDNRILPACLNAWQDIMEHHLYITGAASYREHFHGDFDLPNVNDVGETCVTVTWLQFNAHLLRLTGEARFSEQLEKVILNQLFGAEQCDGTAWGYYVQMEGKKPYSSVLDGHCCLSSGPRGVALIPTFAVTRDAAGIVVNLYDSGSALITLADGNPVKLATKTLYPADGNITLTVEPQKEEIFAVKLRIPEWCKKASLKVGGKSFTPAPGGDGYAVIRRAWHRGDRIQIEFVMEPRLIVGDHKNTGKGVVMYGPLVLAAEDELLGDKQLKLNAVSLAPKDLASLRVNVQPAPGNFHTWPGAKVFQVDAMTRKPVGSLKVGTAEKISLVPFADAGGAGGSYKVWLPIGLAATTNNVLIDGVETRSRKGNVGGSIIDGDPRSYSVTFNGRRVNQDWYAVELEEPALISRVVFVHGQTFHDGGWFDTSGGKPRIQVKKDAGSQWETLATISNYPATNDKDAAGLKGGERFVVELPQPIKAAAIRVIGTPAGGDDVRQNFSSCGELEAYSAALKL